MIELTHNINKRIMEIAQERKHESFCISLNDIMSAILGFYNLTYADLTATNRKESVVVHRKIFAHIARLYGHNPAAIAKHLNLDRSCIYHYYKTIDSESQYNRKIRSDIAIITEILQKYEKELTDALNN